VSERLTAAKSAEISKLVLWVVLLLLLLLKPLPMLGNCCPFSQLFDRRSVAEPWSGAANRALRAAGARVSEVSGGVLDQARALQQAAAGDKVST